MLWVKAFHIIAMVTWFAGLFYLPRLFVYHASCDDKIGSERFKVMERKLYIMMTIGAAITTVLGVWLLFSYAWLSYAHMGWLHMKLALVIGLFAYHYYCGKIVKKFRDDLNKKDHKFYRWVNEIPTIFLFVITLLVVVKPF